MIEVESLKSCRVSLLVHTVDFERMCEIAAIAKLALVISSAYFYQSGCCAESSPGYQTSWPLNTEDSWNYWWSYSGVSGPAYWGLLNLDWFMCDKGRRQSPINVETKSLVYDPHLAPLKVDNNIISGLLYNDGHAIVFNASIPIVTGREPATPQAPTGEKGISNSSNSRANLAKRGALSDELFAQTPNDILKELSNSVELSISQNDRLEGTDFSEANEYLKDKSQVGMNLAEVSDLLNGNQNDENNEISHDDERQRQQEQQQLYQTPKIQFSGAGLVYPYRFEAFYLRFNLDSKTGSEHQINSHSYAAELQLMSYNSLLYKNYAEASTKPHGLLGIGVLIEAIATTSKTQIHKQHEADVQSETNVALNTSDVTGRSARIVPNLALEELLNRLPDLQYRGASVIVQNLNLSALLPETNYFIAYEGSLTIPGCHESVDWLILNRPLYISQSNLDRLRSVSAYEQSSGSTGTLIAGNVRPVQPTGHRPIRTNIRPSNNNELRAETCPRLWTRYEYNKNL